VLDGGRGADKFAFLSQDDGVDTIVDFVSGLDRLQLDDAGFSALARGRLDAGQFVNGGVALDADDFLIYDGSALFYDSDGNGAAAAVQIAELNGATLFADDILVL
jgi:Ca2+-binding RTX toxin-like protein